ncbi:DUF5700 domain-containing putative Zn-dependent protease [Gemmatimonadota bacterium]
MNNALRLLAITVLVTGCGDRGDRSGTFDFSAMEPFWVIQSELASDRHPSEARWAELFETAGFRALTESEFTPEFFRRNFELAFMPSRAIELKSALSGSAGPYLRHYLTVVREREELEYHAERLKSTSVFSTLIQRASEYLPPESVKGFPDVAFLIFANDGRAYDPIVVDLQASRTWDFESFLAHEFHHWYRNQVLVFDPESVEPPDEDLIWALNQIHAEGIADLIDKRSWVTGESEPPAGLAGYMDQYLANLTATPALLTTLDSLLSRYPTSDEDRTAVAAEIRSLVPQSGHPTGFYMASLILENFGIEELTRNVGNPFAFFRTFNRAIIKVELELGGFSSEVLNMLNRLEQKYAIR